MIFFRKYIYFILLIIIYSCKSDSSYTETVNKTSSPDSVQVKDSLIQANTPVTTEPPFVSKIEQKMIDAGLIDILQIDSSFHVDVRYATPNNFMGKVLYKNYNKVYLQPEIAKDLAVAQKALKAIDSTLSLYVFDGTRPRSVQWEMWNAMDTIPFNERVKFLSNPANGSIHNYGCAVDLTIIDLTTNQLLDMGAGYDDLRKIAYPRHEEKFLKEGKLTNQQLVNRKLLRKVMRKGGFYVIQTEWWHFNAFPRSKAEELYDIVE